MQLAVEQRKLAGYRDVGRRSNGNPFMKESELGRGPQTGTLEHAQRVLVVFRDSSRKATEGNRELDTKMGIYHGQVRTLEKLIGDARQIVPVALDGPDAPKITIWMPSGKTLIGEHAILEIAFDGKRIPERLLAEVLVGTVQGYVGYEQGVEALALLFGGNVGGAEEAISRGRRNVSEKQAPYV